MAHPFNFFQVVFHFDISTTGGKHGFQSTQPLLRKIAWFHTRRDQLLAETIGRKETMKDTARVLERNYDGIEYRGFAQAAVEEMAARRSPVPDPTQSN
jgi:hypothetical protein